MRAPCWVPQMLCSSPWAPGPSAVKPTQLLPRAASRPPANSIPTITPTKGHAGYREGGARRAQRGQELCLRLHSQKLTDVGSRPRPGRLPQHHMPSTWSAALPFRGALAIVCGQPHVTITLLVPWEWRKCV